MSICMCNIPNSTAGNQQPKRLWYYPVILSPVTAVKAREIHATATKTIRYALPRLFPETNVLFLISGLSRTRHILHVFPSHVSPPQRISISWLKEPETDKCPAIHLSHAFIRPHLVRKYKSYSNSNPFVPESESTCPRKPAISMFWLLSAFSVAGARIAGETARRGLVGGAWRSLVGSSSYRLSWWLALTVLHAKHWKHYCMWF